MAQQHLNHFNVAMCCADVQQRVAIIVATVNVNTLLQGRFCRLSITIVGAA